MSNEGDVCLLTHSVVLMMLLLAVVISTAARFVSDTVLLLRRGMSHTRAGGVCVSHLLFFSGGMLLRQVTRDF